MCVYTRWHRWQGGGDLYLRCEGDVCIHESRHLGGAGTGTVWEMDYTLMNKMFVPAFPFPISLLLNLFSTVFSLFPLCMSHLISSHASPHSLVMTFLHRNVLLKPKHRHEHKHCTQESRVQTALAPTRQPHSPVTHNVADSRETDRAVADSQVSGANHESKLIRGSESKAAGRCATGLCMVAWWHGGGGCGGVPLRGGWGRLVRRFG